MNDVLKTINLLFDPDQIVEVRAINVSRQGYQRPHIEAGYFDGEHRPNLIEAVEALNGQAEGVYVVMNPFDPALLARAANRIKVSPSTTADTNIQRRQWMLFDVDAGNPAETSSSNEEHDAAIATARIIHKELSRRGWSDAAVADSGNGAHVYVPIDLPSNDGDLVKRCLIAASLMFDHDGIKVDTSVFNPARITKLVGTRAQKGDPLPDRPHRKSKWLYVPEKIEPVPTELLEAFAAYAPDPKDAGRFRKGEFDLDQWLVEHSVSIKRGPEPWSSGGSGARRWHIAVCPWNNHQDAAPYLLQFGNGAIAAGCHHNSCQGNGWQDFRKHYEPDYDPARQPVSSKGGDAQHDATPELSIVNVATVEPERVEWLWENRIPVGKLTLIAGDPDLGKSTLSLDIAARVSRGGTRWPDGGLVPQGNVLITTAEDGIADTVRPRLDSLGANVSNIDVIDVSVREGERDISLSLPDHMPLIEDAIVKHKATLLIIDPLLAFTGGRRVDANKTNEVRPILMQLAAIAERTGCSILCIMHLNKNSAQGNSIYRISASLAFAAAARSVLGVGKHPDDPKLRVLVSIKHNLSAEPASLAYYFDEDGKFTWDFNPVSVDASAVFATAQVDTSAVHDADDFLDQVLAGGSVKWDEMAAEAKTLEISVSSLRRAKTKRVGTDREIKSERVTMGNKGEGFWVWRYPTEDEKREQGYKADTLSTLRNNAPDNGVAPHDEATPVRCATPAGKMLNEPLEHLTKPPLEHLMGTPIDSSEQAINDPDFRKVLNDVRVSQEDGVEPAVDDVGEV